MSVSIMSASVGHFPAMSECGKIRKVSDLSGKSATSENPEVSFLLFRKAAGISQASESMTLASATSFAERPPASWVESTISTLL